jgi:hypothetical protein
MPYDAKKVAGKRLDSLIHFPSLNIAEGMNVILFRDIDGKFATTTNGAIVKKSNGEVLPDDEPLFLFRARDNHAIQVLQYYFDLCEQDKGSDWQIEKMAEPMADFMQFAKDHPERMKTPGITRGQ